MLMSFLGTTQLSAQSAGDYVNGRRIVQQRCVGCHPLSPGTSGIIAPSFPDIARKPRKTEDHLRNWLMRPHEPMPDYKLSREDINDIIAFLHTLETSPPDL
jgi:cytochrome c2